MEPVSAGLLGFLAGLTFWGWGLILAELVIVFPCVAYERSECAFISVVIFAVVAYFLIGLNVAATVWHHPFWTIFYVFAYFVVGAVWSRYQWKRFVVRCRKEFDKRYRSFIEDMTRKLQKPAPETRMDARSSASPPKTVFSDMDEPTKATALAELGAKKIPEALLDHWHETLRVAWSSGTYPPSPTNNKNRITSWIAFWPWSVVWYIIRDVFLELVDWMYRKLANMYWSISFGQFADVDPRLLKTKREED